MGERQQGVYFMQLKAMLVRNILIKKKERRKTLTEIALPLYSLVILILLKFSLPNPNFPVMDSPHGEAELFNHFQKFNSHRIAVVPNTTETQEFLKKVDALWYSTVLDAKPLSWVLYPTMEDLLTAYWLKPDNISIAVIFEEPGPLNGQLRYEIRTNPSNYGTPPTTSLFASPASCRTIKEGILAAAGVSVSGASVSGVSIELGEGCPVNMYYYSGFAALQTLLDYTKIRIETGDENIQVPQIVLEMFPKAAFTGNWMVAFRLIIPLYMVFALTQFLAYLLILIVGEKERKIKEGMKIMGLKDSVFWLSWFVIYGVFVLFLSIVCCTILYILRVFQNTNILWIFLLTLLYSFSVIMFAFAITPFFDKARTAGILGNFAVNIMSLLYYIQVFVDNSNPAALYVVSLISSSGFALAMDKALVMDVLGEGINFDNLWTGPGMPFGGSLIMMGLDVVLYGLLAYYLDCVIPSEHGVKKSPFFCIKPSYWCSQKPLNRIPLANGESAGSLNTGEDANNDVEPVPREMKNKEAIKIVDLFKSFNSCGKPEIKAVNGINLTIYEGQITAILGHNGAGKTTLFNILTGLTAPTAGTAYIFGYDIRDPSSMQKIRSMIGVCPQHDILFDNLTVLEHLNFFAAVKGIPGSIRDFEVKKTIKDVDLVEKAKSRAKDLSGGQKRKLSVGIAVIGDPKIIILDEPTAGVDPYSRRHMWSVLQNRKHGKVILLTTHFMDEADILADRKAVVSKGNIRCCGSSLFLKNKFGIGYHLTLVLEGSCREHAIARLVTTHVPKAEKARRHGRELSFILPHNAVENFAPLFSAIEQEISNRSKLGISSYGVSMTTLEEVFLHLEKDEETECTMDNLSKKIVRNRALSRSLSLQSKSTSYQSLQNEGMGNSTTDGKGGGESTTIGGLEIISETKSPITGLGLEKIDCKPTICRTMFALLRLRTLRMIRDIQKLYFMILFPLALAAAGLYFYNPTMKLKEVPLLLNGDTYGDLTTLSLFNGTHMSLDALYDTLHHYGVRKIDDFDGNFSSLLEVAPHMVAFNVNTFDYQNYELTVMYNDTFQHSLPIALNMINNALYRLMSPEKVRNGLWEPIDVLAQPFQHTAQPEEFNIGIFVATMFMGMIFVMIPVSLSVDMVYDREIKAKNQLRVNGLTFSLYFIPYFIVLGVVMLIIFAALLGIILIFDIPSMREWPALTTLGIMLVLYCPSSILATSCISYIFDKFETAQSALPNIATIVGFLPYFVVVYLDMLRMGGKAAFVLHTINSLFNTMYTPYAIVYYVQRVHVMCKVNYACSNLTLSDYMTDEIVAMVVGCLINIPFWFVLLMVLDIKKSGGKLGDVFKFSQGDPEENVEDANELSDIGENEDNDVKVERQKVKNLMNNSSSKQPVVMVQNLHKEYVKSQKCCQAEEDLDGADCSKVAIKSLSLAVDAGEVFGLLGHNGAGKTTTMKIITAEESPTRGRVHIAGASVTSNMSSAFQLMGYCPQHDALWKNLTVREHIETYAAIRGVKSKDLSRLVNHYLSGLQIHEHADKQTHQCSGGTRRKLSFAMAMVGNPKVVLMDEPSTGMDPRSKRFLWDTILASFQGSRGAILTTHSMEEADALCSRVGIMVKGELRCLGSTQHLKNLYGAGYTLEMKLKGGDSTPTSTTGNDRVTDLREFVSNFFPEASLQETFVDRLVFSVPQQSVSSLANCFLQLEKAKLEYDIEEYSFSQTTLEQVFLKFAHYDESDKTE